MNAQNGDQVDGPDRDGWEPWSPQTVAAELAGLAAPWCVAGGWAIDLWLGRQTRHHHDIEVTIPRMYFHSVQQALAAFKLYTVGHGIVCELPLIRRLPADRHQIRVLDPVEACWKLDIKLEPGDGETWVFRRDERIRAPRSQMVGVRDGIPYLKPEAVLLFKAKAPQEKDEVDFDLCCPLLDAHAREWLRQTLQRVHPCCPWIAKLNDARRS